LFPDTGYGRSWGTRRCARRGASDTVVCETAPYWTADGHVGALVVRRTEACRSGERLEASYAGPRAIA